MFVFVECALAAWRRPAERSHEELISIQDAAFMIVERK